jgi:hypothetical protein
VSHGNNGIATIKDPPRRRIGDRGFSLVVARQMCQTGILLGSVVCALNGLDLDNGLTGLVCRRLAILAHGRGGADRSDNKSDCSKCT